MEEGDYSMNNLIQSVTENALFVLEFLGIVVAVFLIAYAIEKIGKKRSGNTERVLSTKKVVAIGMFSAIATVLFFIEFPVGFAPGFYKLDFSELPALIAAFAYGPVAGVMVEFVKIVLKVLIRGTNTAFVGELANFVIGCGLIVPASVIYSLKKSKKTAVIACIVGTIFIAILGSLFNGFYLLPAFSKLYGMPIEAIVAMGTEINENITSVWSLVAICVIPLNLLKGIVDSVITLLIYKPISRLLKNNS